MHWKFIKNKIIEFDEWWYTEIDAKYKYCKTYVYICIYIFFFSFFAQEIYAYFHSDIL